MVPINIVIYVKNPEEGYRMLFGQDSFPLVSAFFLFCFGVFALLRKLDEIHKTLIDNKSSDAPSE